MRPRFSTGAGLALALALTAAAPAALAAPPAHLRMANFVIPARTLTVRVCRSAGGDCRTTTVPSGALGAELSLPAARYRISVSGAGPRTSPMTYGLGKGRHFILAFYGVASTQGGGESFWHRLRQALAGIDARSVKGYRFAHRMILLRPGRAGDRARIRAANLVPFSTAMSVRLATSGAGTRIGPLPYAAFTPAKPIDGAKAVLSVTPDGSDVVLAEREVSFPAASASVIFVVPGKDGLPGVVIGRLRRAGRR